MISFPIISNCSWDLQKLKKFEGLSKSGKLEKQKDLGKESKKALEGQLILMLIFCY